MEELNNHQMILLTMFVSFVVSIATGIITVAMLQQAPETLTQTVNRVVEHTIERVITGTSTPEKTTPTTITNITKEVTVYAKEDDLVVAAVEKNQPRVVRIYTSKDVSVDPNAVGFVVSQDGIIATEHSKLLVDGVMKESYIVMIGSAQYSAVPIAPLFAQKQQVALLKLTDLSASTTLDSATFGRTENPKLGQTVVVLGGTDGSGVFKATLSRLRFSTAASSSTPSGVLIGIETSPRIIDQYIGGLVVNLDSQAIGIVVPDSSEFGKYVIYPVARILEQVGATSAQAAEKSQLGVVPAEQNAAAVQNFDLH